MKLSTSKKILIKLEKILDIHFVTSLMCETEFNSIYTTPWGKHNIPGGHLENNNLHVSPKGQKIYYNLQKLFVRSN